MFRLFDLFRRAAHLKPRRATGRRLGLESLEGRAVPASLAAFGQDAAYAMTDHADARRVVLTDILISRYESQGSASSRVTTSDFHFVQRMDKASPGLFASAQPEGADPAMPAQSPALDAAMR